VPERAPLPGHDATAPPDRLAAAFAAGHKALIGYLPLGDPRGGDDLPALYADCGVDVLEIGVPGGEPSLDGRTIVESIRRARTAGLSIDAAGELTAGYRAALPEVAMVWMTYPLDDLSRLVQAVGRSGADGLLIPGSARSQVRLRQTLARSGVHLIQLLEHDPRLRDVESALAYSSGYLMLQANPARTGARARVLPDSANAIAMLRRLGLETPLALGIGIADAEQARAAIRMGADGVVVGSLIVETMQAGRTALRELLLSLREAIDDA
jgi:tryptophan synthase alpha chain